jgi:outer membrane cobalamin receptor
MRGCLLVSVSALAVTTGLGLGPAYAEPASVQGRQAKDAAEGFVQIAATQEAPKPELQVLQGQTPLMLAAAAPQQGTAPPLQVVAQADEPETVLVFGRAEQQIGIAGAASEGAVGGADLTVRPILRVAELLEAVPGLIAAAHSGSGKANQYFLRGMNLDHGTDFAAFIDDVPWNLRTHGHGQGYLDINGLLPETVTQIDYRKGPYRADLGDFALAGAAILSTTMGYDRPFAQVEAGSFGWYRALTGGTFDVGGGQLTLVGQYKTYNGPWELAEHLQHWAGFGKYVRTG